MNINSRLTEPPLCRKHWASYKTGWHLAEKQGTCPEGAYTPVSVVSSVCNDYRQNCSEWKHKPRYRKGGLNKISQENRNGSLIWNDWVEAGNFSPIKENLSWS